MRLEEGLRTYLVSRTAITALVGQRIYAVRLPQAWGSPAITFQRISADRDRNIPEGPDGRAWERIQIDVWARHMQAGVDAYDQVRDIADALRTELDGYTGLLGAVVAGPIILESDRDLYEDETGVFRASLDFTISHLE